jgi:isoleucyl-tRNA synthetase
MFPQDIIKQYGADILRVGGLADYTEDQRIGPEIIKTVVDSYRKLRNTLRWALGSLAHYDRERDFMPAYEMPELERYMLHRLTTLDATVREAYDGFDFQKVFQTLFTSPHRSVGLLFRHPQGRALLRCAIQHAPPRLPDGARCHARRAGEMACPLLPFTMEEVWQHRQ